MDYPGGPPTAHGCVFYAVNYGGNFFWSRIEIFAIFLSILYQFFGINSIFVLGPLPLVMSMAVHRGDSEKERVWLPSIWVLAGAQQFAFPKLGKTLKVFFRTVLLLCKKNTRACVAFLCLHFCDVCASVWVLLPSRKYVRRV